MQVHVCRAVYGDDFQPGVPGLTHLCEIIIELKHLYLQLNQNKIVGQTRKSKC